MTAAIVAGPTGAQASAILGVAIPDANADGTLRARRDILNAAINDTAARRLAISDVSLDPAVLTLVDEARTAGNLRTLRFRHYRFRCDAGQVIRNHVTQLFEPEIRQLGEYSAFAGNRRRQNHVECGQAIGLDYQQLVIAHRVQIAHLAAMKEREAC